MFFFFAMHTSVTQNYYQNIARWNLISKRHARPKITELNNIVVHMHKPITKDGRTRDTHVITLCIEILTNQKVSPTLMKKGTYRKNFSGKKPRSSIHASVTLRKAQMYRFLDKFLLGFSKHSSHADAARTFCRLEKKHSFYQSNLFEFSELNALFPYILKPGALQININYN